eukprot:GFUD01100895.1.p1 GENE.GFUD01100895.1~~GFUD01100895.1.p1  ORF type:complete len:202 (-),score=53.30 GFUD01100895.1:63-668(-)
METLGQNEMSSVEKEVVSLSQDSFYRELSHQEIAKAEKGMFNFDHPDAFDHQLMETVMQSILSGKPSKVPVYDFKTHSRVPGVFTTIYPSDVVLVEGILVFYYPTLRDLFDLKLFVDTDPDTRLARRVLRDIEERGRDLDQVLHQYTTLVKPAFADVIVPRGAENAVALDLIKQYIQDIICRSKQDLPLCRSWMDSEARIR